MYEMTYSPSMCQHFEMCLQMNQQGRTPHVYMLLLCGLPLTFWFPGGDARRSIASRPSQFQREEEGRALSKTCWAFSNGGFFLIALGLG